MIPPSLIGPALIVAVLVVALVALFLFTHGTAAPATAWKWIAGFVTIALGLLAISRYKPRGPDVITKARADEAKATDAAAKTRDKAVQAADARRDAALAEDTTDWINERERKETGR